MTDWLDTRAVQGLKEISDYGIDTAAQRERDKGFAMSVLEAIAALPEPPIAALPQAPGCGCGICVLHRIWRVARVVTGKEDAGA